MQKKWGKPKERMPFPVSLSSRPSSFRAQREIFLAQRSSGERQLKSSRSTHAILSLPHKYRVPLRRKRSLGYARDDDTRERAISHGFSSDHVEGYPCGAVYPPPSARPFFKGLLRWHVKTLTLHKVSSPVSSFRAQREIFLAQRSNGERQLRSSRSTHAILSLPHKYRVPLRRKRPSATLGMTQRENGRSHIFFHSIT